MTQNATLIFDSLFLHDTQMADLEREQTALRKRYLEMTAFPRAERTFNFAPPFCRLPENGAISGKLTIAAPVALDGWIVRPVSGRSASGGGQSRAIQVPIPGFPQLPDAPCFILGYAGDLAEPLLARASAAGPFSVSARYRATLTLEIGYGEGGAFSCVWTVGPARWEKA